jgi:ribonuclease P protein component
MIPAKNRFHGHNSLRIVYSKGQAVRGKYFVCKHIANHRRTEPRIAVVISKKVLKAAVGRNRIRRRLYEAIRLEMPKLHQHSDVVFIVTSAELMTLPASELHSLIGRTLKQAGLYKPAEN